VLASLVHFTPGARTAWHRHSLGQSLFVTEGIGLVQRRGGPLEVIQPGDRVYIEPDEEHWHGATATRLMVHVAINEVDEDHPAANWGEHVTDEEYVLRKCAGRHAVAALRSSGTSPEPGWSCAP
jgi:quercetin dioxygenase-like cupin family protein